MSASNLDATPRKRKKKGSNTSRKSGHRKVTSQSGGSAGSTKSSNNRTRHKSSNTGSRKKSNNHSRYATAHAKLHTSDNVNQNSYNNNGYNNHYNTHTYNNHRYNSNEYSNSNNTGYNNNGYNNNSGYNNAGYHNNNNTGYNQNGYNQNGYNNLRNNSHNSSQQINYNGHKPHKPHKAMSQNGHHTKPKKKKKKRTNKIKSQNRAHRKAATTNNALGAPSNGYSSSTHKSSVTSPNALTVNITGSPPRSKRTTSNPRQFRHKFNMTEMQLVIGQIGEMKKSWKTPAEEVMGRIYEIIDMDERPHLNGKHCKVMLILDDENYRVALLGNSSEHVVEKHNLKVAFETENLYLLWESQKKNPKKRSTFHKNADPEPKPPKVWLYQKSVI